MNRNFKLEVLKHSKMLGSKLRIVKKSSFSLKEA